MCCDYRWASVDIDGCANEQLDSDGVNDGVVDANDQCADTIDRGFFHGDTIDDKGCADYQRYIFPLNAVQLSVGRYNTSVVQANGTVHCWGLIHDGQGSQTYANSPRSSIPVAVSNISTAQAVSSGSLHSCALLGDGTVECWGDNTFGVLGVGYRDNSNVPLTVLEDDE